MKKILTVFLTVIVILSIASPALAVVGQSEKYYAADYADVLSEELEDRIVDANADLEQRCDGAQIVVVTVNYLDGMYSDEYAMTLFNSWGVGSGEYNNGMLLLLGIKENKGWLTVGKGISGVFTDDMANEYLDDYLWPEFDRGNYEAAVECLLDELFAWYAGFYHVTGDASDDGGAIPELVLDAYEQDRRSRQMERTMDNLSAIFRIIVIALIIIFYISRNDRRRHNAYYRSMHVTPPPYFFWYMFNRARPYRNWVDPSFRNNRNDRDHRPPGGGGFGGGHGGGFGGFGGFGGGGHGGGFGGGGGGFGGGGGGRR